MASSDVGGTGPTGDEGDVEGLLEVPSREQAGTDDGGAPGENGADEVASAPGGSPSLGLAPRAGVDDQQGEIPMAGRAREPQDPSSPARAAGRSPGREPQADRAAGAEADAPAVGAVLSAFDGEGSARGEDDRAPETAWADAEAAPPGVALTREPPHLRTARPAGRDGARRPPPFGDGVRDRVGREAVGIAVLVVLALVCAGLITAVVVKTRNDAAVAAREAAAYTPPPLPAATPMPTGPIVAIIGDDGVTIAAGGVGASERWPALLADGLSGTVSPFASAGSGYTAEPVGGSTFSEQAARIPADADAVVFFGGGADGPVAALSIARGATDAFAAARERAPDAKILVVGPVIRGGLSSTDLTQLRNALRSAAMIAGVTWVDPIDLRWLPPSSRNAQSPSQLTAADERSIAGKVRAAVRKSLR